MALIIARESFRSFMGNRNLETAATLAFYGFLSLLPLLFLSIFSMGLMIRSSEALLSSVEGVMQDLIPSFNDAILEDLFQLTQHKSWGIIGAVLLVWSMTPFAGALRTSMARVFKVSRRYPLWKAKLLDLAAVLGLFVLLVAMAGFRWVLAAGFFPVLETSAAAFVIRFAVVPAASFALLCLFFRVFVPVRVRFLHLALGSGAVLLLWLAVRRLFVFILTVNPDYGYAFGSLKTVFLLIIWVYYSCVALLFAAELMANAYRRDAIVFRDLLRGGVRGRLAGRTLARHTRTFEPGQRLFEQGEEGGAMYVIAQGGVILERDGRTLAELGEGAFFGEMSLLLDAPRSAAAVIRDEGTRLITIDHANIELLLRENPELVMTILKEMASRLERLNRRASGRDA